MQTIEPAQIGSSASATQEGVYQEITHNFLVRAGLQPGMRVLDAGSGLGHVAFIAANLVGATGEVLGFDLSPEAVASANRWAADLKLRNVRFIEGDLADPPVQEKFDAVIGRFTLLLVPDPVKALAQLAARVKPGGIVAFQELDYSGLRFSENLPLAARCLNWVSSALRATGADPEMGLKLYKTFIAAGLPRPSLCEEALIGGGENFRGYEMSAATVAMLQPAIEQLGLATREEIEIDTLASRLRDEVVAHNAVIVLPGVIGAWTQTPTS
jgi:ubiquinone/menaquinone biosynthesis C-methylase UbiE